MKSLFMESTKISPETTVGEIQRILGIYKVTGIWLTYDNGEVTAVSFEITIGDKKIPYRLPCRWQAIYDRLAKRKIKIRNTKKLEAQAKRVAWRQILRWVESQLALVETDMVKMQEVFLPYWQTGMNETLFDRIEAGKFKALTSGEGK